MANVYCINYIANNARLVSVVNEKEHITSATNGVFNIIKG